MVAGIKSAGRMVQMAINAMVVMVVMSRFPYLTGEGLGGFQNVPGPVFLVGLSLKAAIFLLLVLLGVGFFIAFRPSVGLIN